jgi:hypothetical protein
MAMSLRGFSFLLLLACSASAAAQEWVPLADENERLYQEAERNFDAAVDAAAQKAASEQTPRRTLSRRERDASGQGESGNPLTTDPMNRPAPKRVGGKKTDTREVKLEELLPPTLDFAAPRSGGLILQRMSSSVLFGRTGSEEILMLPLSGDEMDLAHGMRASIREVSGHLRLAVGLASGTQALFEYLPDPDPAKRAMTVLIRVTGGPPGTDFELKRLYRQAQVNVGPLRK